MGVTGAGVRVDKDVGVVSYDGAEHRENVLGFGAEMLLMRNRLDLLFSGGVLCRLPIIAAHCWAGVLEHIDLSVMAKSFGCEDLCWDFTRAPVICEDDRLIVIDYGKFDRALGKGFSVGILEWGVVTAPNLRVALAAIPTTEGREIRIFGNHTDAAMKLYEYWTRLEIGRSRRLGARDDYAAWGGDFNGPQSLFAPEYSQRSPMVRAMAPRYIIDQRR